MSVLSTGEELVMLVAAAAAAVAAPASGVAATPGWGSDAVEGIAAGASPTAAASSVTAS